MATVMVAVADWSTGNSLKGRHFWQYLLHCRLVDWCISWL